MATKKSPALTPTDQAALMARIDLAIQAAARHLQMIQPQHRFSDEHALFLSASIVAAYTLAMSRPPAPRT